MFFNFFSNHENRSSSVDAILFDLGMSSMQVDSTRGFSFRKEYEGELGIFRTILQIQKLFINTFIKIDMRMSPKIKLTAKEVVNSYSGAHLATIFHKVWN